MLNRKKQTITLSVFFMPVQQVIYVYWMFVKALLTFQHNHFKFSEKPV